MAGFDKNLPQDTLFEQAKQAYDNGDYNTAVQIYAFLAEQGHLPSQNSLGYCYDNGDGVEKDPEKAVYWYTKAAEQGDAKAQFYLGVCYYNGEGVEKDLKKAAYWYTQAAEQGDEDAQFNLALCYDNGEGVEKDLEKAAYWYTQAARQGDAKAQCNLGVCYYNGEGVEKDLEKAAYWYTRAAGQGDAKAQFNLALYYDNGEGVEKDLKKAAYWYTQAAVQGYAMAQLNLGVCYKNGYGVEKDLEKAAYWYTQAAVQGYKDAQFNLGVCYDNGEGVEKDRKKAAYWYTQAAVQGNAKAQFNLGVCYKKGEGVEKDLKKALSWLYKALENGEEFAREAIEEIEDELGRLTVTETKDAFVSWNHNDRELMSSIESTLLDNDISVWQSDKLCTNEITPKCKSAVENSKSWIVLVTENALKSTYIPQEIEWIFETVGDDKELYECIIPVYGDGVYEKLLGLIREDEEKYGSFKKIVDLGGGYGLDDQKRLPDLVKNALARRKMIEYRRRSRDNNDYFYAFVSSRLKTDELIGTGLCTRYDIDGEQFIKRTLIRAFDKQKFDDDGFIRCVTESSDKRRYLLVGEGGSGKSLYLSNIVYRYFDKNRFIFKTDCKSLVRFYEDSGGENDALEKFFVRDVNTTVGYGFTIPLDVFYGLTGKPENKVILLIDGVDELGGDEIARAALRKVIERSPLAAKNNVTVVLTSRNTSDAEILGINTDKVFTLEKFTVGQAKALAAGMLKKMEEKISPDEQKDVGNGRGLIQDLIARRRRFDYDELYVEIDKLSADIAENPLLVTNFTVLFVDHVFNGTPLPKNKFEIADRSIKFIVNDVESERDPMTKVSPAVFKRLSDILCDLALKRTQDSFAGKEGKKTEKIFEDYIRENVDECANSADHEARELNKYLRSRAIIRGRGDVSNVYHALFKSYLTACALFPKYYEEAENDFEEAYIAFRKYEKINGEDFLKKHDEKYFRKNESLWADVVAFVMAKLDSAAYHLPDVESTGIDENSYSYPTIKRTIEVLYPGKDERERLSFRLLREMTENRGIYNEAVFRKLLGLWDNN